MRNLTVFDTSVATRNVGDEIIMESVYKHLLSTPGWGQVFKIPTHNYLTVDSWKCLRESDISFVGGTNLLSSNMPLYNQWKIAPWDLFFLNDVVLMGVGWWQYQKSENFYTKSFLRRILSSKYQHSVRDSYTKSKLNGLGVSNVVNTGCPTMWSLTSEHCARIPVSKADSVVYTLTDYNMDRESDEAALRLLRESYGCVALWLQGSKDYSYYLRSGFDKYVDILIPPRLDAYDELLESGDFEYVGTRLHAGVRALQKGCRSLILAVDNRAIEKQKDYSIHVIPRADIDKLSALLIEDRATELRIDFSCIDEWKSQFFR